MNYYNRYKYVKEVFNVNYRGFNMGHIMAMDIILIIYKFNIKFFIKEIIKIVFTRKDFSHFNDQIDSKSSLITYTTDRDDYIELIQKYINKLKINTKILFINDIRNVKTMNLKYLISSYKKISINKNFSLKEKIYFILLYNYHKILIDSLLDQKIKLPISYYAFNSSTRLETLLSLYFKQRGIETFSFQHGMYFNFKEPIPMDVINYENFVADKMLCWGEYSIDELVKFGINKDKLILFGNPKYNHIIPYTKKRKIFQKALVLLSRQEFETGNKKLFNIFKNIRNIHFEIKLHPSLDLSIYKKMVNNQCNITIIEEKILLSDLFLNNYDFVITYNTSAHYEALISGLLTYGYNFQSDGGIIFKDFHNTQDLMQYIHSDTKSNEQLINTEISQFINYTLGI